MMILSVDPITIAKIGILVKKHWKPILIGLLSLLIIIGAFPVVIANILIPNTDEEQFETYKNLSHAANLDWAEVIIYDMVRYENDLSLADPEESVFDFIQVNYKKYKITEVCNKYNDNGICVKWKEKKKLLVSKTLKTKNSMINNLKSNGHNLRSWSLESILNKMRDLDKEKTYSYDIITLDIQEVMRNKGFDQDEIEWAMMLLESNIIYELFGEAYNLPEHIPPPDDSFLIWPAPTLSVITSQFGQRVLNGNTEFHYGLDISGKNAQGQPIVAAADGVVFQVNQRRNSPCGLNVRIRHIDDEGYEWQTRYCHMAQINVEVGQEVEQGDVIGAVGSTGRSTGPHLHLEMKAEGRLINPYPYIRSTKPR